MGPVELKKVMSPKETQRQNSSGLLHHFDPNHFDSIARLEREFSLVRDTFDRFAGVATDSL